VLLMSGVPNGNPKYADVISVFSLNGKHVSQIIMTRYPPFNLHKSGFFIPFYLPY